MKLHGKLLNYIPLSVFFRMEHYPHDVFNTSYICMNTCALFNLPSCFAAHLFEGKTIQYSDSVIFTALLCGVTGCALGLSLVEEII